MTDRHLQNSLVRVTPRFIFRMIGSREGNGEVLYCVHRGLRVYK